MSTSPGPATAPGLATASWGRRIVALFLDWAACSLVSVLVLGAHRYGSDPSAGWVTLAIFWLESAIGTATVGASFGQLLTRVRVLRADGRVLPLIPALARQLCVCLVIPPLVFKPDGRGLHDLWTRSAAYALPRPAAA